MAQPKRSKVVIFVLATAVVAALVGAWRLMSNDGGSHASDLAAAKAKIEEIGFTVDPEELGRRLFVPSGENAAPIFVSIGSKFASDGEIGQLMIDPESSVENCRNYNRQHREIFDMLLEAAGKAGCDFGRDWSEGPAMLLPELAQAKGMVKYCAHLAKADAADGDYDGALQKLLVADRIGSHIGKEPMIIGKLVENACRSIVLGTATDIFDEHPYDPAASDLVSRLGDQLRSLADVKHGLQGEVILGHVAINEYTQEEIRQLSDGFASGASSGDRIDTSLRAAGEAVYLERIAELHRIWSQIGPAQDVIESTDALSEVIEGDARLGAEYAALIMPVNSTVYRSSAIIGAMSSMFRKLGEVIATIREDGADVAVEEYDGRFADIVSNKEFKMSAVPGGFKFYSMGLDGNDDGGPDKIGWDVRNETNDDFGFWISLGTD